MDPLPDKAVFFTLASDPIKSLEDLRTGRIAVSEEARSLADEVKELLAAIGREDTYVAVVPLPNIPDHPIGPGGVGDSFEQLRLKVLLAFERDTADIVRAGGARVSFRWDKGVGWTILEWIGVAVLVLGVILASKGLFRVQDYQSHVRMRPEYFISGVPLIGVGLMLMEPLRFNTGLFVFCIVVAIVGLICVGGTWASGVETKRKTTRPRLSPIVIGECSKCRRPIRVRTRVLRPEMKLTCKCGAVNVVHPSEEIIQIAANDPDNPKLLGPIRKSPPIPLIPTSRRQRGAT